jgi:endonuclease III
MILSSPRVSLWSAAGGRSIGLGRRPTRRLRTIAAAVLPRVDSRLRRVYGPVASDDVPLGNKRNPLDELIYIQLSVRTREAAYQTTYQDLRRVVGGAWDRLLLVPERRALSVMEPGGMARLKLDRLRAQIASLRARFGRATLAPLRGMPTPEAETILLSLPGVGPKVARCVLLYSLGRDVFPVDSNCHRVLSRLGFLPQDVHLKAAHNFLQDLVPLHLRRSLHVNLVRHGRAICVVGRPRCESCPILALCPTGARLARAPKISNRRGTQK